MFSTQLNTLIEQLLNRIAMADHERLFQQNDVCKKRGRGYVILSDSQQSCCVRKKSNINNFDR